MMNEPPISPRAGRVNIVAILITFLAIGLLLFAILSIYAFGKAHTATSTLESQKAAAAAAAAKKQAASDKAQTIKDNESPYRSYTAPDAFGNFVVSFPKNWSGDVVENDNATNQVVLSVNPNFVSTTNNDGDPLAAKVTLVARSYDQLIHDLADAQKNKKVTETPTTISKIKSMDVSGTFPNDKKTIRAVYIPVRDKTIVISTENAQYMNEYTTILSQIKIYP